MKAKTVNPSTKVDFAKCDRSLSEWFGFSENATIKEKIIFINNLIAGTIKTKGVEHFYGNYIYDIENPHNLAVAIFLIKRGIAGKYDFMGDKVSKIDTSALDACLECMHFSNKVLADGVLSQIAWEKNVTKEGHDKDLKRFVEYKSRLSFIQHTTEKIDAFIKKHDIDKYNGVSLYEISSFKVLKKALANCEETGTNPKNKQIEIAKRPSNLSMDEMLDFILEHKN